MPHALIVWCQSMDGRYAKQGHTHLLSQLEWSKCDMSRLNYNLQLVTRKYQSPSHAKLDERAL